MSFLELTVVAAAEPTRFLGVARLANELHEHHGRSALDRLEQRVVDDLEPLAVDMRS